MYFDSKVYHQQWRGATGKRLNDPTNIVKLDLRKEDESHCAYTLDATKFGETCPIPEKINDQTKKNMFNLAVSWGWLKNGQDKDGLRPT